jgi:beta-glucosidase
MCRIRDGAEKLASRQPGTHGLLQIAAQARFPGGAPCHSEVERAEPMTHLDRSSFGAGFKLGVATSAYQIEGATHEGGRGASIWDRFCQVKGAVKLGHSGEVACDHYHRMQQDVELMRWLGVDAYRFSVAWSRILPTGRETVCEAGLDFYERLVDCLLRNGIEPCVTLYHWDLPDALPGGWLSRDTALAFAEYAGVVARRLGDRVTLWLTHNEPWCQAFLGYEMGLFAPGHRSLSEALLCAHHLLVSHGLGVQALRAQVKAPVGIAPNFMPVHTANDSPANVEAARRYDGHFNRWFLEPVLGLGYPPDMVELYGSAMPSVSEDDLRLIAQPIDVVGVNYYERIVVADAPDAGILRCKGTTKGNYPRTMDREIYPQGLLDQLRRLHQEYGIQRLVVTENGAAFPDQLTADGKIHDTGRVEFLRDHLEKVAQARAEGIPVEAYFAWSLMDNFEWNAGYTLRYGLFHVDFESLERTAKDSAVFYRSLGRG